jgi:hypothetical protein
LNRVLMERARAMLIESGLPDEMWAEAVVTANYIRNRTPVSAHGKTPWEAFYGKKPDVSHMRVFGARAFMHVPGALRHKLEPVSEKGWFIGYEVDAEAYRILRERDNRVIVSRDVIVNERAKGNEPRSEFEVSPVEAPGEKPGLGTGNRFERLKTLGRKVQTGRRTERKMGKSKRTPGRLRRLGEPGRVGMEWRNGTPLEREGRPGSDTGQTWRRTGKRRSRKPTRRRWRDLMPNFGEGRWTRSSRRCWRTERGSLRSCRTGSRRCP